MHVIIMIIILFPLTMTYWWNCIFQKLTKTSTTPTTVAQQIFIFVNQVQIFVCVLLMLLICWSSSISRKKRKPKRVTLEPEVLTWGSFFYLFVYSFIIFPTDLQIRLVQTWQSELAPPLDNKIKNYNFITATGSSGVHRRLNKTKQFLPS